jgi:hypothetical protein
VPHQAPTTLRYTFQQSKELPFIGMTRCHAGCPRANNVTTAHGSTMTQLSPRRSVAIATSAQQPANRIPLRESFHSHSKLLLAMRHMWRPRVGIWSCWHERACVACCSRAPRVLRVCVAPTTAWARCCCACCVCCVCCVRFVCCVHCVCCVCCVCCVLGGGGVPTYTGGVNSGLEVKARIYRIPYGFL